MKIYSRFIVLILKTCLFAVLTANNELSSTNISVGDNNATDKFLTYPHQTGILTKSTFSPSRLLFVAGLEGTGHHALAYAFHVCVVLKRGQPCEIEKPMSMSMFNTDCRDCPKKEGLFFAEDVKHTGNHLTSIRERMKILSQSNGEHLFLVGLGHTRGAAMMSYPNFDGANKALAHPDVFVMAMLAEEANIDFRILVIQRNAKDVLASTVKREFGGNIEARILIDNAAALYAQLSLLDNRFYHCLDYSALSDLVSDEDARRTFREFVHPTIISETLLDAMMKKVDFNRTSSSPEENSQRNRFQSIRENYELLNLASRMNLINTLCRLPLNNLTADL